MLWIAKSSIVPRCVNRELFLHSQASPPQLQSGKFSFVFDLSGCGPGGRLSYVDTLSQAHSRVMMTTGLIRFHFSSPSSRSLHHADAMMKTSSLEDSVHKLGGRQNYPPEKTSGKAQLELASRHVSSRFVKVTSCLPCWYPGCHSSR